MFEGERGPYSYESKQIPASQPELKLGDRGEDEGEARTHSPLQHRLAGLATYPNQS